jgi:phosphatidylserine/phosphatidylglycerophosphate/cardiolipin synthase-like enzyme
LFLVDGIIGITGGRNIGDNYFNYSLGYNFKDRDVLLMGPEVAAMSDSFARYWGFKHTHAQSELKDSSRRTSEEDIGDGALASGMDTAFFGRAHRFANDPAHIRERFLDPAMAVSDLEFVADKPGRKTFSYFFSRRGGGNMATAIRKETALSTDSILIQSPYVILNRRARRFLRKVKKKAPGLRVQISTNSFGAADHLETYSANFRLRTKVIRGLDFDLFEYKPHPEDLALYLANFRDLKGRAKDEGKSRDPFLSIHSKSYVFDNRAAFIGTHNLDPRSFYINSECGLFVRDEPFVQELGRRVRRDMAPANSWIIAPKRQPLGEINVTLEGFSSLLPIDLWPLRSTSSFELIEGKEAVPRRHPEFYGNYRELGNFPGSEGMDLDKTMTRMYKRIGKWATPLL